MKWEEDYINELCIKLKFYRTQQDYNEATKSVVYTKSSGESLTFQINQDFTEIQMLIHKKEGGTVMKLDIEIAPYLDSL